MRYVVITLNHAQFNRWIHQTFDPRDIRRKLGDRLELKNGDDYTYCNCPIRLRAFKNINALYVGQYFMLKDLSYIKEVVERNKL